MKTFLAIVAAVLAAFTSGNLHAVVVHPLVWDAMTKEHAGKLGETNVNFTFVVTNTSATNIVITAVKPSCGCTAVQLPAAPWIVTPGGRSQFVAAVDLRGKSGILSKAILVESTAGPQSLLTRVNINPGARQAAVAQSERMNNVMSALADRQKVFKGDCAACHATPTEGKKGAELYMVACGICHDAEHRATMVPDLRVPKAGRDRAFWLQWVMHGKAGTLMPAFHKNEGGPLTDEQVQSLVELLEKGVPAKE